MDLQFGHGMGAVETQVPRGLPVGRTDHLQFGHGMGAVETQYVGTNARRITPSIRPRHGSRGDMPIAGDAFVYEMTFLQFGHGMGAVETAKSRVSQ